MAEEKKPGSVPNPPANEKRAPSDSALTYGEKVNKRDVTNTQPAPPNPNGGKGSKKD